MKVGSSYSRCIRDIVDGTVDINDVLVVITRTDFDPHNDEQWHNIWHGYGGGGTMGHTFVSSPEWSSYSAQDEDRFRSATIELWETGRLHQPRRFGANPRSTPYHWLETVLPSDQLDMNPTVKSAWDHFQTVAGLSGLHLDQHHN